MFIKFRCENCGQKIGMHERFAGRKVKCPDCAFALVIPHESQPDEVKTSRDELLDAIAAEEARERAKQEDPLKGWGLDLDDGKDMTRLAGASGLLEQSSSFDPLDPQSSGISDSTDGQGRRVPPNDDDDEGGEDELTMDDLFN